MGDASNTERLVRDYFDRMGSGDARGALALLADEATYEVMGTTPISGPATGRREIIDNVFVPFTSRLENGRIRLTIDEVIAQGDRAAVIAHSEATGTTGLPYNNKYVFIFRTSADRILSLQEYLDTALVETAIYGKTIA